MTVANDNSGADPLRIAVLVKQVPVAEAMTLGENGRLERNGIALEMNPYCRRAVTKGCELAASTNGTCIVFTLGPPSAEDVLREAIAWGVSRGVHVCDPAFAGSDTLATARTLAAALRYEGPFDLILMGRNSVDGETGQVGPELAEILDLAFACGAKEIEADGRRFRLKLEHDDGWDEVEVSLPAVISVAERLCEPCKVDKDRRADVPAERIEKLGSSELGPGPWGDEASPSKVGEVRALVHNRDARRLQGPLAAQVLQAVEYLNERGALPSLDPSIEDASQVPMVRNSTESPELRDQPPIIGVLIEPNRSMVSAELLGAASELASTIGGTVVALAPGEADAEVLGSFGADSVIVFEGSTVEEDVAAGVVTWAARQVPWAILAPSTSFGREVAGRSAAALGAGLVGDAIGVHVQGDRLVAPKPAFSGAMVADITSTSAIQMVTIRPGVLALRSARSHCPTVTTIPVPSRGRVTILSRSRDDDVEVLARASAVIGVGAGLVPADYEDLSPLAAILGAELAASRKVTDKGWAPRSRQVGITGRSIAPSLYVAIGLSGKFNHMVGVRSAGTILAINCDPEAPVFEQSDVGIIGDWREVVPLLEAALRDRLKRDRHAQPTESIVS